MIPGGEKVLRNGPMLEKQNRCTVDIISPGSLPTLVIMTCGCRKCVRPRRNWQERTELKVFATGITGLGMGNVYWKGPSMKWLHRESPIFRFAWAGQMRAGIFPGWDRVIRSLSNN